MKYYYYFFWLIVSQVVFSQDNPENTIVTFFEAFHKKDTIAMKKVCHQSLILQTVANKTDSTRLKQEPASEFFKSFARIPKDMIFFEKILSYKVQIDANLAHVWTPYEVYINNKFVHKGVNSFTLIKEPDGNWKIIHLIDTRRKD
ncbi:nuclear transport factor 2 family protein [Flavobacterium sp.]|uniref:nuclear transport factor 2 family protein n=1 Tax=Flavobacterium sp. TaxID=239 RepID=UPI003528E4A2